ncbi:hypothetical protein BT67DRAFT_445262, partial [Trichocladium antarcticum]
MLFCYNLDKYLLTTVPRYTSAKEGNLKKTFDKLIYKNEGPAFVTIPNKNKKNDETLRYYKDYGKYPSGGPASNCWICNPELALDN